MNPKLRDLQIQAFAECKKFEEGQFRTDEVFERFAELIVRECAAAAFDWYENHHNFHWDPATHVLGHFGVE